MLAWTAGLVLGGGALALGTAYVLAQNVKPTTQPGPVTLAPAPGTIMTSLTPGQHYRVSGSLAAGYTNANDLAAALSSAGWANPNIQGMSSGGGAGPTLYTAFATWNGPSGPVPQGMVAQAA
jgi:hypothetical protein